MDLGDPADYPRKSSLPGHSVGQRKFVICTHAATGDSVAASTPSYTLQQFPLTTVVVLGRGIRPPAFACCMEFTILCTVR